MLKTSVLAVSMVALGFGMSALAQRPSPVPAGSQVAWVSGQRLSSESNQGKAGASRLQALQQEKAVDIRARQQAVEAARAEASRAGDAGARARLEEEERQRRAELERAVAQAQADVQNMQRQISSELTARIRTILEEVVAGTDVLVVLQSDGPVLWAAPGLDLTPVVLERLNAQPGGMAAK